MKSKKELEELGLKILILDVSVMYMLIFIPIVLNKILTGPKNSLVGNKYKFILKE